jgi:hypothetical protein
VENGSHRDQGVPLRLRRKLEFVSGMHIKQILRRRLATSPLRLEVLG